MGGSVSTLLVVAMGWCVIAVLGTFDRRLTGTWVTPFTVLALPEMVVITAAAVFAVPTGFVALSPGATAVLLLGLVVFWAGALGIQLFASAGGPAAVDRGVAWQGEAESRTAVMVLSWVLIGIMALGFYRALQSIHALGEIVQEGFQRRFEQGLSGLARPVAMLVTVYWIGSSHKPSWWGRLTLAGLLLMLFASFVKGTVLLPLIGGLLYRVWSGRARVSWLRLAGLGGAGVSVVFLAYLVQASVWGIGALSGWSLYVQIARRALSYVFAGVLGFSRAWDLGMPASQANWAIAVAPAWNLFAHFIGSARVPNLSPHYVVVDLQSAFAAAQSNVRTLFGTLIDYLGLPGAVVATFVLGSLVTMLFDAARRSRNCWLLVILGFVSAALFFGWFDYYFALAFWYIAVPLGLMLAVGIQAVGGTERMKAPAGN